nr:phosphotransferase [Bacillus suaedaesalsae]
MTDGFQNLVYSYESTGEERILRVTSMTKRSYAMIEEELQWIHYLSEKGISVAGAIPSINGNLIEMMDDFYVTAFHKANGSHVHVDDLAQWNKSFFEKWGQTVGKLHNASKSYPISKNRPTWSKQNRDLYQFQLEGTIKGKYEKLLKELDSFEVTKDTFGLVHFDLHQGNFFVHDNDITLFDFDDCSYYWFAHDIAVSYYHAYWQSTSWHPEWKTFGEDFLHSFLDGYKHQNTLSDEMIKHIPTFLKIRDIFLYQLFQEKWNHDQLLDWQKEKLDELLFNIENEVTYPIF